jgi:hypothetical protein
VVHGSNEDSYLARCTTKPAIASAAPSSRRTIGDVAGMLDAGTVVIVDVIELFVVLDSGLVVVTDAVFDTAPGVEGSVKLRATVAEPRALSVRRLQVTVVVPLQLR